MSTTQHLTRTLHKLCTDSIATAHTIIQAHSTPPADTRFKLGLNLGILLAHCTTLESPYAQADGLPSPLLNTIAEDLSECLAILQATANSQDAHKPASDHGCC